MQPVLLQSSAFLEVSVTHMAAKCVEFVFNMIKETLYQAFLTGSGQPLKPFPLDTLDGIVFHVSL